MRASVLWSYDGGFRPKCINYSDITGIFRYKKGLNDIIGLHFSCIFVAFLYFANLCIFQMDHFLGLFALFRG